MNPLSKLQNLSLTDFKTLESLSLFGDIKVSVNILLRASYINTKSPNLTHSSRSLPFFLLLSYRHTEDMIVTPFAQV